METFLSDHVQPLKLKAPVPLSAQILLYLILKDGKLSLRGGAEQGSGEWNLCPHEDPLLCGLWLFILPLFSLEWSPV